MTDLTTGRVPVATGATQIDDSGFSDTSAGDILASLSDVKHYIDFGEAPNLAISSSDPDFVFALIPEEGGTSSPVFTIDSVGTGNGGSFEFMTARGVGGAPENTADFDYLGSIYWAGLIGEGVVQDSVTITVRAGENYVANNGPAGFEVKTQGNVNKQPRFFIDWDGDTNIQNGVLTVESHAPASSSATGKQGTVTWDSDFIYICVAPDTWKRAALLTW